MYMTIVGTQRHTTASGALYGSALVLMLLASGCGTGTSATGAWQEPRSANVPYRHVLVVGVTQNSRMRRSFEQQMVEAINGGGTKATASVHVASEMGLTGPLSRDAVVAMVERTGVEAVLVTRLLGRSVKADQTKGDVTVKVGPQVTVIEEPGMTQVWAGNYSVDYDPGHIMAASDANVESTLFDVADKGRPVYKIGVETKFKEENADVIVDIAGNLAAAIVGELRKDQLVK